MVSIFMISAATIVLAGRPIDAHRAAGVFPPWWSHSAILDSASQAGSLVAAGTLPFIVVVQSPGPDVVERLRRAGALFAIDARSAKPCGTEQR